MTNTEVRADRSVSGGSTAAPAVRIDDSKSYLKNTLRAFVDFTLLDSGLSIKGASVHEKESKRWLSLPSREYVKNGEKSWVPTVEFSSREARDRITDAVLAAFDAFSAQGAQ